MALTLVVTALLFGQAPTSSTSTAAVTTSTAAPVLIPPRPLVDARIAHPPDAPPLEAPIEVKVRIRVDEAGLVESVALISGAGEPFDSAVLQGAAAFRFTPGLWQGQPVPVDISFTQRFEPLPPAPIATGFLVGEILERGTKRPIPFAELSVSVGEGLYAAAADEKGVFSIELPGGQARVEIFAGGFDKFVQTAEIKAGARTSVRYLLERSGRDPWEVVVTGKRDVGDISRTTLRGKELTQIPGTFGDPFRVVGTLPGVSQMMSLLPFPIVRGSSPGNTGFLIDGIRVPLLFHLLAGPSVIHPALIDSIEFSPGGFPVEYGGYTGGIVDGKTRPARQDEVSYDADLNLLQIGGLVRRPLGPLNGTFAGRLGYPGLLMSLASPRQSLSYWDYQARLDGGDDKDGFSIFAFGARDSFYQIPPELPDTAEKEPFLRLQFHRVDLGYRKTSALVSHNYRLTLGYDDSLSEEDATLSSFTAVFRGRQDTNITEGLDLRLGADLSAKQATFTSSIGANVEQLLGDQGSPSDLLLTGGFLLEAFIRPSDRWLIRPGIRVDLYDDGNTANIGVDPRLMLRHHLSTEAPDLWLKGGVGLYHQPPRFTVPIPGLDSIAFERGLLRALQTTLGAELALPAHWSVDVQTYFNWMDPIFYDVNVNPTVSDVQQNGPDAPPGQAPIDPPEDRDGLQDRLDELLTAATGRSYGFELLLRREFPGGVAGWLAYTFSRSERLRDGVWSAFDFDRTHILNVVVTVPLPRRWNLGFRTQVVTGRPLTTTTQLAGARTDTFVRFDLRVDKTAVWNDWLLDFYVDISNAVLGSEELTAQNQIRYVLPTVGFRAMF